MNKKDYKLKEHLRGYLFFIYILCFAFVTWQITNESVIMTHILTLSVGVWLYFLVLSPLLFGDIDD